MKKKECPSCAMQIEYETKVCPICGYEFPQESKTMKYLIIFISAIFLLLVIAKFL